MILMVKLKVPTALSFFIYQFNELSLLGAGSLTFMSLSSLSQFTVQSTSGCALVFGEDKKIYGKTR